MNRISSSRNPLIREVKALKYRKNRKEKGLYIIEGAKLMEEALESGADIIRIFISEFYAGDCEKQFPGFPCFVLPDALFTEIADTKTPQGILAVVRMRVHCLDDVFSGENLFILLDALQDPGNMGTVIRTADAANFSAVIALDGCVDVYNPKVIRSTMGSIFHIPVLEGVDPDAVISKLRTKSVKIYATHPGASADYFHLDLRRDAAVIIGNESKGISREILRMADLQVRIPMPGRAESLNASVAAGLILYESVRQRIIGL